MAIANLHETLLNYTIRKNDLNTEITELQSQKTLATYSQADVQSLLSTEKHSVRDYFKNLYENDSDLQAQYKDYTDIPDFEEEIDKIVAKYQEQLEELTAWETQIDNQITTDSAELEEIEAYMESYKQMLSTNIQSDFDFGLNS
jgi:chromosome segregation ATPase